MIKRWQIHRWLRSHFGPASKCENPQCEGRSKNYQWAKKTGSRYAKRRENFIQLCQMCHVAYDGHMVKRYAHLGGKTTSEKYGSDYMRKIGKRGRKKQLEKKI